MTWKLKDGVKWSDGTPFTSADVKATWQYIVKPETGATDIATFLPIASIDTPDATTAKITFKAPTATWYFPFAAGGYPVSAEGASRYMHRQGELRRSIPRRSAPGRTR